METCQTIIQTNKQMAMELYNPMMVPEETTSPWWNWAASLYEKTVVRMCARFYMAWRWRLADWPDICASLTGSPADFWVKNPEECSRRIAKDFTATIVTSEFIVLSILSLAIVYRVILK